MTTSAQWTRNTFADNKKLTVINFFGGAGVGKSTTAAALFAKMKQAHYKVEFVHEVAKDYVWEKHMSVFGEQDFIFANQHRMIRRLTMHDVDYAIVDSSILLSLFYMTDDFPQSFRAFVLECFNTYDNLNIFLERTDEIPYTEQGRNETKEQAIAIDNQIKQYFIDTDTPFHVVRSGNSAADECAMIVSMHKKP